MKRLKALLLIAVVCLFGAQSAYATIGWAGNIWPLNNSGHLPTNNLTVYAQVWKGGVTDAGGQGANIEAWLYYKRVSDGAYTALQMTYNTDIGSNDEYMGSIPAVALNGGEDELAYVVFKDLTDNTEYTDVRDQQGNGPLLTFHILPGTSIEVAVTFSVDLTCVNPDLYAGGVYFVGDFLTWAVCHPLATMSDGDGDGIWEGTWYFEAGSNPQILYKFQTNDGTNCIWENGPNRPLTIDDSSPTQVAPLATFFCETWGPSEISVAGSYCVGLCCCPNGLWIPLNTQYNPPILSGVTIVPGCINCDGNECLPGSGDVEWVVRDDPDAPGTYYLVLCIIDTDREVPVDGYAGCFCVTIDEILPVELNSFAAVGLENAVRVAWTTSSERNTDHFILDRSTDVNSWSPVAELAAAGNSESAHHYTFTDNNVVVGTTYSYRLTVVDMDGSRTTHSSVASATPSNAGAVSEFALSQNYPNPFNPETSISYTLAEASRVSLKVYNIAGEEIATLVNGNENAGNHNVNFSAANLPTGLYFYRLDAGDFSATRKMMLLK